jgi:hypothetical protein
VNELLLGSLATSTAASLAVCGLSLRVLSRYVEKKRRVEESLPAGEWDQGVLAPIRSKVLELIQPVIGFSSKEFSLDAIVPKVEGHEDYTTMHQLLTKIASAATFATSELLEISQIEQFVKAVYQFQVAAGLGSEQAAKLLAPAIANLQGRRLYGKAIRQIDLVEPKARVDESRMWPLNSGLRVQQPYGIVIHSEGGEILSRAKVRCS